MPTDKPRISFALPEDLMKQIDEFRFDYRIRNQSQAVIKLMEKGLEIIQKESASNDNKKEEPTTMSGLSEYEHELVTTFRGLNDIGQAALLGTARGLVSNPDMKKGTTSANVTA